MVAELHGLTILDAACRICPNNTTRFLVIGQRDCPPTGHDRTSLMFGVPDRAGALFAALEPLQRAGISMSKIESRPSKRKPWEYVFFVDVEGHRQDAALVGALAALEGRCSFSQGAGQLPDHAECGVTVLRLTEPGKRVPAPKSKRNRPSCTQRARPARSSDKSAGRVLFPRVFSEN